MNTKCRSATTGCAPYRSRNDLIEFFEKHDRVYVVEQNRDGQMAMLVKLELPAELVGKLRSIRHYSGIPIDARFVTDELVAAEKGERK